jgi:hypothetical protein
MSNIQSRSSEEPLQKGTIVRLDRHGLAIVKPEVGDDIYPFTFDKILEYGGQTASEMGLHEGSTIQFVRKEGKVSEVKIVQAGELAAG